MAKERQPLEQIELDIDHFMPDLVDDLIAHVWVDDDEINNEAVKGVALAYARAAYGKGVCDALAEPELFRNWIVSAGYANPKKANVPQALKDVAHGS